MECGDSIELLLKISKLEERGFVYSESIKDRETSTEWTIKVRVDNTNNLGLYINTKAKAENNSIQNIRERMSNFRTAVYNFQIEDCEPVYECCGMFSFPRGWNYLYGPSKLITIPNLRKMFPNQEEIKIRVWVFEDLFHSMAMHYIAANFYTITQHITQDGLISFPYKDLYSIFESQVLLHHEDLLFTLVDKYSIYHKGENITDLLKCIKFGLITIETLTSGLKNTVLLKNDYYLKEFKTELNIRSILYLYIYIG